MRGEMDMSMAEIRWLFTRDEQDQLVNWWSENDRENNWSFMCARDLFSLGCHLQLTGHAEAGKKACHAALQAMFLPGDIPDKITASLDLEGQELEWVAFFKPHREIQRLFESADGSRA
jgi:hypothetical protein